MRLAARHRMAGTWLALLALLATAAPPAAMAAIPVPPNDNFANAATISTLPFSSETIATTATVETGEPQTCGGSATTNTVWYEFTAPATQILRVTVSASTLANNSVDPVVAVLHGAGLGALSQDAAACTGNSEPSSVELAVTKGATYYIQAGTIHNWNNFAIGYVLDVAAQVPANDFFRFAQPLGSVLPRTVPNVNITAATPGGNVKTFQPAEPEPSCESGLQRTVWYSFKAPTSTTLRFTVSPSTLAGNQIWPVVAVYDGSGLGSLYEDGCATSGSVTKAVSTTVSVTAGTTYYIQVGDAYWATASQAGFSLTIADLSAPTVGVPACAIASGSTQATTGVRAKCAWTGTAGANPITKYSVELSTDGAPFAALSTTTTAYGLWTFATGHQYRVRVMAVDAAGRTSGWATSNTFSTAVYEETLATYGGTWTTSASASYHGGGDRYAKGVGASASITVTGRSIAWVALRCASCGRASVYVNGVRVATVDLYAATTSYRVVAWASTWSTSAARTIKIVGSGTAGRPRIDVDAVLVVR